MLRLKPLSPRHVISPKVLRAADFAIAFLFLTAFAAGGTTALSGIPQLARMLQPDGAVAYMGASIPLSPAAEGASLRTPVSAQSVAAIAIVIDDLGNERGSTERAIRLPSEVALSFLPFAEFTPAFAAEGRKEGHDVLVHMPMESFAGRNDSPDVLTIGLSSGEVKQRLEGAFARVPGFAGLNNHEGSRFTSNAEALQPVVEALKERGAFFLDSRTAGSSQVVPVAQSAGIPSADRDVFLDDTVSRQEVTRQLRQLEQKARMQGIAIAIGHPHAETLDELENWVRNIEARGFRLASITEAIRLKMQRAGQLAAKDH